MSLGEEFFEQFGQNAGFIKEQYELYCADPSIVDPAWVNFFNAYLGLSNGNASQYSTNGHAAPLIASNSELEEKVHRMIRSFRERGHLEAKINPLTQGIIQLPKSRDLQIEAYGFSDADLEQQVRCDRFQGNTTIKLRALIQQLNQVYCGSVGFEFSHLNEEGREFLRERIESYPLRNDIFSIEKRKRIHTKLIEAELMESELHKKYVGNKRFSLQGGDTLIPMLDMLLESCLSHQVREVIIGMPHRGRLNVLANVVGKPLGDIFNEFEDQSIFSVLGSGDVKYHLGYSGVYRNAGGSVAISMAPNPSHLEFVDPVLEGMVRARQDIAHGRNRQSVLPVLIHGDAAFIGQGVVYETLNLVSVPGHTTGGTLHIVVNNQIGFTTNPDESRSSIYCSDMAKGFDVPVFHANAEDPEACCWVTQLALEYRTKFQRDVVIDLYCYRRYGHNEGDDPSFTQPQMYQEIQAKKTIATLYGEKLTSQALLTEEEISSARKAYSESFKKAEGARKPGAQGDACPVHGKLSKPVKNTGVSKDRLKEIGALLTSYPQGFTPHPKLHKILEKRVEAVSAGVGIDWGLAEGLALGSILQDGYSIRFSGQDAGRGTFSQRHLALSHYEKMERFLPFKALEGQNNTASLDLINSVLSEAGVLGFEYGYSSVAKDALVIWEAQFGDFANGAQVIIDQFIASSEAKWGERSGVVLLLPHGFEGQGPEHSSARLERYLQLCAEGNMTVCYPSNAAQHFHLLRRQALSEIKRPLIVMTPKSLLRHAGAGCGIEDLVKGKFEPVLATEFGDTKDINTLILMSGKVYYDVENALKQAKVKSGVKVLRVEELYPYPSVTIEKLSKNLELKQLIWIQEEPKNMGAWDYISSKLRASFNLDPKYIGRAEGASPATGSGKKSAKEQEAYLTELIGLVR